MTDIDLNFRPDDYWAPLADPTAELTRNVKGQARRKLAGFIISSSEAAERVANKTDPQVLSDLRELLLAESLDDPTMFAHIDPTCLGGEFLPDCLPSEVEIARIVLLSVEMEVVSVRAGPEADGLIHYRAVDEYDAAYGVSPEHSEKPLTSEELVDLIDDLAIENGGMPPNGASIDFVESLFYPGLRTFFKRREWGFGRGKSLTNF